MKERKALLIIDMQKGSFTEETPRFDTPGVVKRINELSEKFRKHNAPVIIIQHDGSSENSFIPNTKEWELLNEISTDQTDILISKTANDSFYQSKLERVLTKLGVLELVITGCATDFCVNSTVQSALVKNYKITVAKNAHTTGERPGLEAEEVIKHYNWVWGNMVPVNGNIKVVDADQILNNNL